MQAGLRGLHIIGAANGSPLLKTCINEGVEVIRSIARLMPPSKAAENALEQLIIGAGPAGIAAALEARRRGYRFQILEQSRTLNTLTNFPEGKCIYAEPAVLRTLGELAFEDATKEELLAQWGRMASELEIVSGANVRAIESVKAGLRVRTATGETYHARRVILAIGRMGNPRRLGSPGEDLPHVHNLLLNPRKYAQREIVVVGGGNSAVEAALALRDRNRVTLVYRGSAIQRASRRNRAQLAEAQRNGTLQILLDAQVTAFRPGETEIAVAGERRTVRCDEVFVLIGTDPPTAFLRRLGVAFEGEWRLARLPNLAWVLALIYSLYALKAGRWPMDVLYAKLHELGADPSLLYGLLYTGLLTFFGMRALRKYRRDPLQRMRYATLIAAQWLLYFLLPWVLYYAGYAAWWRTWGVTLAYPLGYYGLFEPARTLFTGTALPWALATLAVFLIVTPLIARRHGKRFCAWVCPCGGMAETVGDFWRHKAPRGQGVRRIETLATVVLVATVLASILIISDYRQFLDPDAVKEGYRIIVDFLLASVVAITLYPFAGPRIWCRFFCPLAKWLELWARWTGGGPAIVANDECISCGECTRFCQMGIDVRAFAQRGERFSNRTTCCISCGICVTVCPVDVLHVEERTNAR